MCDVSHIIIITANRKKQTSDRLLRRHSNGSFDWHAWFTTDMESRCWFFSCMFIECIEYNGVSRFVFEMLFLYGNHVTSKRTVANTFGCTWSTERAELIVPRKSICFSVKRIIINLIVICLMFWVEIYYRNHLSVYFNTHLAYCSMNTLVESNRNDMGFFLTILKYLLEPLFLLDYVPWNYGLRWMDARVSRATFCMI